MEKKKPEKATRISDSKNVVTGSNIQGQNIHIGDVHYHNAPSEKKAPAGEQELEGVRKLISRGRLEQAIASLLAIAEERDAEWADSLHLISGQFKGLQKQERLGTLSYNDSTVRRNQIMQSVLQVLREMQEQG
ncbi:MAG: hypothetical protein KDE35_11145 [Geminicoccaceae bacterium]|nr:hypothetical protein [Geminicoccaceae bacterium]